VVGTVRERSAGLPLFVVGHSLGAHTAMAALGIGAIEADGLVAFACSPWLPAFDPSLRRRVRKRLVLEAMDRITRAVGYLPARRLRLGSDDECSAYVAGIVRPSREGRWRSEDFRHDYTRALANVRAPVLAISSAGDRFTAHPAAVDQMLRHLGGRADHFVLREGAGGRPAPGHMGIVTSTAAAQAWQKASDFLHRVAIAQGNGTNGKG
jgi:predicted alpha/beta hydrolase